MTTAEERLARKISDAVSHRDFSPEKLAYYLGDQSPYVQAAMIRVGLNVTEMIADKISEGASDPEYGLAIWLARELKLLRKKK